jgi:hypothetical protein
MRKYIGMSSEEFKDALEECEDAGILKCFECNHWWIDNELMERHRMYFL